MASEIGGIEFKHVIMFQTQVMMGNQFGRIIWAREKAQNGITYDLNGITYDLKDEILIACLRMGWNDAFRHVSENVVGVDDKIKEEEHKNKNGNKKYGKQRFDDYFCVVLNNQTLLRIFCDYAKKEDTEKKCKYLEDEQIKNDLRSIFGTVKKQTGTKALCFGHIQKMFNIALKLYLCIYMCRESLELDNQLFYYGVIEALKYADCPIDSIVLNKLDEKKKEDPRISDDKYMKYGENEKGKALVNKKFSNIVWSKINGPKKESTIEAYKNVQYAIATLNDNKKSNLYFDFTEWKNNEYSPKEQ